MIAHYNKILKDTDRRVEHSLKIQVKEQGPFYGGFVDGDGLVHSKFAIYRVTSATAAYCNKDSVYYRSSEVFEMIRNGLIYIAQNQHENGLFDLINCNFYSAPDTAFCVKRMLPTLKYLDKNRVTEEEQQIYEALREIVRSGAQGLKIGGFHTPNHRWAIASNLMECGRFFGDKELEQQADQYLNEGIDCNEDGEYAEKSAGNYNRINNDAMITLGDMTGEERFYEYAIRNLRMMLTYLEPDGSIFTANSTRQDNGVLIYPKDYYLEYLDMGYRKSIPEFLDVANYLFELIEEKRITAPDFLIHFMNHPEYKELEHKGVFSIPEYRKYYKESGIVRVNKKEYTYTLLSDKSGFLHFSNKTMRLQMKVAGGFCEHRAFHAETVEEQAEGFHLEQTMRGWYYLPFKEKPDTSDWWKMDNAARDKIMGPDLKIEADVTEAENGIDLHVKLSGVEQAPFRVEIEVAGADLLWNDQFAITAEKGKNMVLKQGNAIFSNSEESLEIGPGFGAHLFTSGKFGSEAGSNYAFTLYFTDYTEFDHVIKIRTGDKAR